jgi:transposase
VEDINDEPLHLERVAALDIGKATLEACVRVPGQAGPHRRAQEVRSFGTTKKEILLLAAWLRGCQVAKVVMEATSDYWKAPFFRLEAEGFDCDLLDAKQVKALPGRTGPTLCGWPRSPSGAWWRAVSCRPRRSAGSAP